MAVLHHYFVAIAMSVPHWLSKILSGTSFLDVLHNDCTQALTSLVLTEDVHFRSNYESLINKIERAFQTEERWMEEIDFPELKHHREQHASILSLLYQGQAHVMRGDFKFGRRLAEEFLPQWLLLHASTMDAALANEIELSAGA